jgi:hypothetical protein
MEVIDVPILGRGLHFGLSSDYKKLKSHWFEQNKFDKNNYLHKAIIIEINYKPDEIYNKTDGYWGRCWLAVIFDSSDEKQKTYNFRNFADLIELFEKNGYKFIEA